MALSFLTKVGPKPAAISPAAKPFVASTPGTQAKAQIAKSGNVPSWMKTGTQAKQAVAHADAMAEKAKEDAGRLWSFWMPPDEERKITFLDGALDEDGMLDVPMFYQHRVKINGDFQNFVCVAEKEPCPCCEAGDSKPVLVGVMTAMDHTAHTIKSGPNAGKTLKNTRKLFVATRQTLRKLAKKATKTGGLAGCTFEVSRSGDKVPGVGDEFEFVEKHTLPELAQKYGLKPEEVQPADYNNEIVYRTAEELIKLGAGKAKTGPGYEKASKIDTKGLASEL